jgi:hypothetical protein
LTVAGFSWATRAIVARRAELWHGRRSGSGGRCLVPRHGNRSYTGAPQPATVKSSGPTASSVLAAPLTELGHPAQVVWTGWTTGVMLGDVQPRRYSIPFVVWHSDALALLDWLVSGQPGPMPSATPVASAVLLNLLGNSGGDGPAAAASTPHVWWRPGCRDPRSRNAALPLQVAFARSQGQLVTSFVAKLAHAPPRNTTMNVN